MVLEADLSALLSANRRNVNSSQVMKLAYSGKVCLLRLARNRQRNLVIAFSHINDEVSGYVISSVHLLFNALPYGNVPLKSFQISILSQVRYQFLYT